VLFGYAQLKSLIFKLMEKNCEILFVLLGLKPKSLVKKGETI